MRLMSKELPVTLHLTPHQNNKQYGKLPGEEDQSLHFDIHKRRLTP